MKFSINIEIPAGVWFVLHLFIVIFACIIMVVLDTRGIIPWTTFTIIEEILAIFVYVVVFFGGIISVMWHFVVGTD